MKLDDIINEENISEVPVGVGTALKTGLKAMNPFSTSGRAQAQGAIVSNKRANDIYSAYYKWVGQHNFPTTSKSVIDFLKQNRYPDASIKAAGATMKGARVPAGAALDKNVISKAFLAAAQKFGTASPAPRRPGTAPAPASSTPTPASEPSPEPAKPAIDIKDIYNHYKAMSPEQRKDFRTNLDLIDSEPETPEPMDINEGYSRYLGIQL